MENKKIGNRLIKIGFIVFVWSVCLDIIFVLLSKTVTPYIIIIVILTFIAIICVVTGALKGKRDAGELLVIIGFIQICLSLQLTVISNLLEATVDFFLTIWPILFIAGIFCVVIGGLMPTKKRNVE